MQSSVLGTVKNTNERKDGLTSIRVQSGKDRRYIKRYWTCHRWYIMYQMRCKDKESRRFQRRKGHQ